MRYAPELALPAAPHRRGEARPRAPSAPPERALRHGVDLLNHGCHWEAHEAWEALWRASGPGQARDLLQGIIQIAAARFARAEGRAAAAARLTRRGLARLRPPFPADDLGRIAAQLAADRAVVVLDG